MEKVSAAFGRSVVREKDPSDNNAHAESRGPSCQGVIAGHFSVRDTLLEVKLFKRASKNEGTQI